VILIPLLTKKLGSVQVDKDNTALEVVIKWLEIAVQAAEEAARAGLIGKTDKYEYALGILERQGITFDASTAKALIDSTVWKLFNQFKEESEEQSLPDE
jgi:hypothetical protein